MEEFRIFPSGSAAVPMMMRLIPSTRRRGGGATPFLLLLCLFMVVIFAAGAPLHEILVPHGPEDAGHAGAKACPVCSLSAHNTVLTAAPILTDPSESAFPAPSAGSRLPASGVDLALDAPRAPPVRS